MSKLIIITAMVAVIVSIVWVHSTKVQGTATASPISIHKSMENDGKSLPVEEWSPIS